MRRWPVGGVLAALGALSLLGAMLLERGGGAEASSLSRGPGGWLAARRYLEERGCRVALLDVSLGANAAAGVVAVAFPWQTLEADLDAVTEGLETHLEAGGTLLLAVAGDADALGQGAVLKALGLEWRDLRGPPPLLPWRWREFAAAEWFLASPEAQRRPPVRIEAPRGVPRMPESGEALRLGEGGVPVVFVFPRKKGRVVVLPANALANGRISDAGNADLLEQLRTWLGDDWAFDELHHGLAAAADAGGTPRENLVEPFLLHLALLYVLAVLALARRFGPAWAEPAAIGGSTAQFLIGLGALHHRLGHHPAAARLLVERARDLDPRLPTPQVTPGEVSEGKGLLELGKSVARAQARKGDGDDRA